MANSQNNYSLIYNGQNKSNFAGKVCIGGVRNDACGEVLNYVAKQFNDRVETLVNPGCWGWAPPKAIPGSSSYSNHGSGTAIDLNAPKHPWKVKGTFSPDKVGVIRQILAECENVVRWGGDYTRVDEMHFEINADYAAVSRLAAKLNNSQPVPPQIIPTPTPNGFIQLRPGSNGPEVTRLQKKLKELALYNAAVDGNYGPITKQSVINYQLAKGLVADGWAGPITQGALYSQKASPIKHPLGINSRGAEVVYLQQRLRAKGLYHDALDGHFGPITKASVKELQRRHHLSMDGYVGPITRIAVG